ncbi:unnamed protein product [Cylicocyclus nassatus]|uniref:Calcineurin-like phosphoesterase domain-containing protein n=1 Tax=Cylicocyclus nassatus TaxID=53992 RepID=A0AA36GFW0_CYLNA|nr:unnamed protein product [Cylicocyclus nassatus]
MSTRTTILLCVIVIIYFFIWRKSGNSEMKKVDPNSEEDYWDKIKANKIQTSVEKNSEGEINTPPQDNYLKVVCISDTHNQLDLVQNIPDGDVLIHAGDLTNYGSREELEKLFSDLLRHRHKLIVAGNHDLGFDDSEDVTGRLEQYRNKGTPQGYTLLQNVTYLHDKSVEIDGVKFFGSSWHPLFGYPFYVPRPKLESKWKAIPSDLDVLITHTPPLGYLDLFGDERWGCRYLLNEIETRVKPRFHVFGHVHERYGAMSNGVTTFINAAQANRSNVIVNDPIVFYIPKKISAAI